MSMSVSIYPSVWMDNSLSSEEKSKQQRRGFTIKPRFVYTAYMHLHSTHLHSWCWLFSINLTGWGWGEPRLKNILSVELFLDLMSIWNGRRRKAGFPRHHGWASSNQSRACTAQNMRKEELSPLFLPPCLRFTASAPQVLRFSDSLWNTPLAFLKVQLTEGASVSRITWANSW